MNKKGQEFFSIIIFFAFAVLLFMITNKYTGKQADINLDYIGKNQAGIKQIYEKAENDMFFIDLLAKYASWNAFYKLAGRGGFKDLSCKQPYTGYCLIDPKNFTEYRENFKTLFHDNFDNIFKIYFGKLLNYTVTIKDNLVVGIATDVLAYGKTINKGFVNYTIKPHFEVQMEYSFSDYENIKRNSLILIQKCAGNENLTECIGDEIKNFKETDLIWQPNECGKEITPIQNNKVAFCVFHKPVKTIYTKEGLKPLLYQFSLDFTSSTTEQREQQSLA